MNGVHMDLTIFCKAGLENYSISIVQMLYDFYKALEYVYTSVCCIAFKLLPRK